MLRSGCAGPTHRITFILSLVPKRKASKGAFAFFVQQNRSSLQAKSGQEAMKMLGHMWRNLPESEKEPYRQFVLEEKKQSSANSSLQCALYNRRKENLLVARSKRLLTESKPPVCPTTVSLFITEQRKLNAQGARPLDMKEISRIWRGLTTDERSRYKKAHAVAKAEFRVKQQHWLTEVAKDKKLAEALAVVKKHSRRSAWVSVKCRSQLANDPATTAGTLQSKLAAALKRQNDLKLQLRSATMLSRKVKRELKFVQIPHLSKQSANIISNFRMEQQRRRRVKGVLLRANSEQFGQQMDTVAACQHALSIYLIADSCSSNAGA